MTMFGRSRHKDLRQMDLLEWMSSAAASPAKTSANLGEGLDLLERDQGYGSSISELLPTSRLPGSLSKTLQPFELADWILCSGASLRSGMMRSGTVYPQMPLVPLTREIGSGSWPTPRCSDGMLGMLRSAETIRRSGGHKSRLEDCVSQRENLPERAGYLNPPWIEWLMGFPEGWTDCDVSETP